MVETKHFLERSPRGIYCSLWSASIPHGFTRLTVNFSVQNSRWQGCACDSTQWCLRENSHQNLLWNPNPEDNLGAQGAMVMCPHRASETSSPHGKDQARSERFLRNVG